MAHNTCTDLMVRYASITAFTHHLFEAEALHQIYHMLSPILPLSTCKAFDFALNQATVTCPGFSEVQCGSLCTEERTTIFVTLENFPLPADTCLACACEHWLAQPLLGQAHKKQSKHLTPGQFFRKHPTCLPANPTDESSDESLESSDTDQEEEIESQSRTPLVRRPSRQTSADSPHPGLSAHTASASLPQPERPTNSAIATLMQQILHRYGHHQPTGVTIRKRHDQD